VINVESNGSDQVNTSRRLSESVVKELIKEVISGVFFSHSVKEIIGVVRSVDDDGCDNDDDGCDDDDDDDDEIDSEMPRLLGDKEEKDKFFGEEEE